MLIINESSNVLNFEVLTVVFVKPAVCNDVKPCSMVEITSVSEEPAFSPQVRGWHRVFPKRRYVFATLRRISPPWDPRLPKSNCQFFELCSRSHQLKLRSLLEFLIWCTELVRRISREGIELRRWKGWRRKRERGGGLGVCGARSPVKVEGLYHCRCGFCWVL
jgi:hypothetical protein